ncbi:ATP-binding protein [Candidatus Viridilinea mediisalina]|uniref:histidine kinase n=1 Tax=Candidatus Viridilinea mediisalina TaxID=2024553 RepID=A0A2A6RE96_9CHLR|nr:ATP-binding protein [Candidatus Viridilinea mediisalina]PDW00826.1 hypothetical protein CJ255_20105 [Candidatus Viridilinea mediisalina]
MILYAIINLGLIWALRRFRAADQRQTFRALLIASVMSDLALVGYLLLFVGPLTLAIFPSYLVMGLKAFYFREFALWPIVIPLLLGPLNVAALYVSERVALLNPEHWFVLIGLMGGTLGFVVLLLVIAEQRLGHIERLSANLAEAQSDHLAQVAELEASNNDLRVRNRRQQALEESLRAITGSLSLDAVLSQILDSLVQMLGAQRVSAAALSKTLGEQFTHATLSNDQRMNVRTDWAEVLARRAVAQGTSIIVTNVQPDSPWHSLAEFGIKSALSVPLIDPGGKLLGALTVVGVETSLFTDTDARHLTSFSIQASVAIHNAELHTKLARQGHLLEAVLNDIGDGLLVLNEQGAPILANPLAYRALQHSDAQHGGLREQLEQLNQTLRLNGQTVESMALQVGSEEQERHYLLYGSLVQVDAEQQSFVAFTLHDTTEQKRQEQRQVEFISMVSHELRNPLHTLIGFLKVVVQERVGPLNENQQEFLGLAADRADELNRRITELLEFNRLESGHLRLQLHWANLHSLITTTCNRFQVQAEQFGLHVTTELPDQLPEILMDNQRIDQVLTNLVENALKATPAGGHVRLSAQVNASEVLVHVTDTGVGVPADQQQKIFSRFYRLEHKSAQHGAHLGLGLAICQQIIEGHNGRIWVESEEGQGSRFTFTLPLVHREQTLNKVVV